MGNHSCRVGWARSFSDESGTSGGGRKDCSSESVGKDAVVPNDEVTNVGGVYMASNQSREDPMDLPGILLLSGGWEMRYLQNGKYRL